MIDGQVWPALDLVTHHGVDTEGEVVRRLLRRAGTTYAQEAGIRLRNQPMPLFQLLMVCMLAGKDINTGTATGAARELFSRGLRTPHKVLAADRQTIADALDRAHYPRDGSSAIALLVELAGAVQRDYGGDLRLLAERSGRDIDAATAALNTFRGLGDTGASIFLREVQDVWPWARSSFDDRVLEAARRLGLPTDAAKLGALSQGRHAELAAALTRHWDTTDIPDQLGD